MFFTLSPFSTTVTRLIIHFETYKEIIRESSEEPESTSSSSMIGYIFENRWISLAEKRKRGSWLIEPMEDILELLSGEINISSAINKFLHHEHKPHKTIKTTEFCVIAIK